MSQQKVVSFAPDNLKEGSNLIDNFDGVLASFKFTKEAPDNYTVEGNPIFAIAGFLLDTDKFPKQAGETDEDYQERLRPSQSYSLGASAGDNFGISDNGYFLTEVVEGAQPRKDSKFGTLVSSMVNEGVPTPILESGDFSKLIGLKAHWKRVPDKERTFSDQPGRRPQKQSKFPPSTLVVTKVLSLPGQGGTVVAAAPVTTSTVAAVIPAGPDDLKVLTLDYLNKVLDSKKGEVQRGNLTLFLSQAAAKDANRQAIAKMGADEAFLIEMAGLGMIGYDPASKPQVVKKVAVAA